MADRRFTIDQKSRVLTIDGFSSRGRGAVCHVGRRSDGEAVAVHRAYTEIFMWEQDYCLNPDEEDYDPFLEWEEGFFMEDLEERLEIQPPKEPEGSPSLACAGGIHEPYRAGYLQL